MKQSTIKIGPVKIPIFWIILAFFLAASTSGKAQVPVFTVENGVGLPGSNIDLNIQFTAGAASAYSTEFLLTLPPEFTFVSKRAGPALNAARYILNSGGGLKSVLEDSSGGTQPLLSGVIVIYTLQISSNSSLGSLAGFDLSGLVVSNSLGTQAVQCNVIDGSVQVTSFVSFDSPRIGQKAAAAAGSLFLPNVRDNTNFRTNLGINNPNSLPSIVNAFLVDKAGIVRDSINALIPGEGMIQINRIIETFSGGAGILTEGNIFLEGDQPITAWASEIDNLSDDPGMMIGRNAGSSRIWIPSAANTGAWTSSMVLENIGSADSPISIHLYSPSGNLLASSQGALTVPAMGNLSFDNILAFLGISNAFGPMEIISSNNQPLLATCRVFSQNHTGGFFEGVPADRASNIQIIPHLVESSSMRTNLGINNWSGQIANVTLRFINDVGTELARIDSQVMPNGLNQINYDKLLQIIKPDLSGTIECYVRIESDQSVISWASQIDNSQNDPGFAIGRSVGGSHLLVPSAANTAMWTSSLVVVNPNIDIASIDITARDFNGHILGNSSGVLIPAAGFFHTENILASLGVTNNFGPIEIITQKSTPLLVTSRIRSANQTGGFFDSLILN